MTKADNFSDRKYSKNYASLPEKIHDAFRCPSRFAVKFSDSDLFYGNRHKNTVISRTIKASLLDKTITAKNVRRALIRLAIYQSFYTVHKGTEN